MNLRNAILLGLGPKSDPSNLTRFERVVLFFTGPWMILPLGWALVRWGDVLFWRKHLPAEISRRPEASLFFQGSNDLGGVAYGIVALALAVFAVTAAWHLSLRLRAFRERVGFGRRVGRSFAVLSPFFAVFLCAAGLVVAETILDRNADWKHRGLTFAGPSTDADIAILFLTAAAVYALSVLFVAWLDGTRLRGPAKTLLASAVAVLWFVLGADGQAPRAGQMLEASWEPLPAVRGARHGAMVAWNDLCLALMGFPARPVPPADSPLWFWTDGRLEFGPDADASPSARALRRRTDLPWVTEGRAFVVPVAVRDDTPARDRDRPPLFPYSTHARAYGGYFLQTPDGPLRILHGSIEPLWRYNDRWYFGWRDVHLRDGEPYWTLVLGADGCRGERKVVDLAAWAAVQTGTPCEPDAPAAPFVPAPQTERAAVSLRLESGATFASFTNLLIRLRDCGYGDVFVVE